MKSSSTDRFVIRYCCREYQEGVMEKSSLDLLTAGFARLTHLKLYVTLTGIYDEPDAQCSIGDIWLITLEVLK